MFHAYPRASASNFAFASADATKVLLLVKIIQVGEIFGPTSESNDVKQSGQYNKENIQRHNNQPASKHQTQCILIYYIKLAYLVVRRHPNSFCPYL